MKFKKSKARLLRGGVANNEPTSSNNRNDTMMIFMVTTGVICWALAGFMAAVPADPFNLMLMLSALGTISSEFTKTFSIGIIAASLAMLGLTLSALALSRQAKDDYMPYEYRKNLRDLARGFCWFNTAILGSAIACSFVSMTNSNYALKLLSKSLDSGQVSSSQEVGNLTMEGGIGFILMMFLLFLLFLNDMAEKVANSLMDPYRPGSVELELSARAEEIDLLSAKSEILQNRLLETKAPQRLVPALAWFVMTAVFVCIVAGVTATTASRIPRVVSDDEPFSSLWSSASAATLLALFQYYIAGLLAAPIKSQRWKKIIHRGDYSIPQAGRLGTLIRGGAFLTVPLFLQILVFSYTDYANHSFQAACLAVTTWLIPSILARSNFAKGTVNSLMALKAADDLKNKIRALSRIQKEEQKFQQKETASLESDDTQLADSNSTESKMVLQLGKLAITISRNRTRAGELDRQTGLRK